MNLHFCSKLSDVRWCTIMSSRLICPFSFFFLITFDKNTATSVLVTTWDCRPPTVLNKTRTEATPQSCSICWINSFSPGNQQLSNPPQFPVQALICSHLDLRSSLLVSRAKMEPLAPATHDRLALKFSPPTLIWLAQGAQIEKSCTPCLWLVQRFYHAFLFISWHWSGHPVTQTSPSWLLHGELLLLSEGDWFAQPLQTYHTG